ncbi:unnamed protein product [Echinostoma caproni]|uniref:Annexin n=1 Tax=Echinostoma caproni TaxID=27848 RepID=A0A183A992_9TREM|nr:unnamed protein product [Echinostoma caproni]
MYRSDSELAMSIGHIGKAPLRYRFPIRRPPPIYPYHNAPYHELIAPAPGAMYYGPYYGVSPGYVPPYVGYRGMVPAGRLLGADEVINPSLRPYPNFNVFEDCERLHQAMKGYGVDEKAIIDVIGNRSVDQRLRIVEHYRLMYGKDLVKEFRTVLSGHFFDCIEALLFPPQDLDAVELRKAIRGAGTDEDTLIEILYTRSNAQIKLIKEAYKRIFLGRDLETDIRNSTCGHFRAFLLTQLENVRDESETVDWNLAHDDAVKLFEAADKRNVSVQQQLLDLLSTRSPAHMRCVFDAYARVANKEIEVAMESHVSGELLRSYVGLIYPFFHSPYPELIPASPAGRYIGPFYGVNPTYVPPHVGYKGIVHGGRILGMDEVYEPTLRPFPRFDVVQDCERLNKAMKGFGTNEKTIIDIMGHRSVDQRTRIVDHYKLMFSKDLMAEFKSELSGYFLQCVEVLCHSAEDVDAIELRKAIRGHSTDEDTLLEILCTRSNAQVQRIKEAYNKIFFGRDLVVDIRNDTFGHFKQLLINQCSSERSESQQIDRNLAQKDAQRLFDASEKRLANTESQLNELLCTRSFLHMRFVFEAFARLASCEIEDALKKALTGDLLNSYLGLIRMIRNKPNYFAERLRQSMKGLGTNDTMLIRLVVTRCELDMGRIKHEFALENNKSLARWIVEDTSGDYRKLLLALINEEDK